MLTILIVFQALVALGLVALILVQHGKGADMGAAFGSGASGTVFGSQGSGSFLTKATTALAVIFFINCLLMATPLVNGRGKAPASVADRMAPVEAPAPAADTNQTQKTSDLPDLPGEEQAPAE